jgi:prepilin-type processing-associated H-X9-DG protein
MANYIIIGDDNKEYGPVSAEELRKWIAAGRADAHTKVRAEGTTEWQPLSQFPELADALKKPSPPPFSTTATAAPPAVAKTSAMAITSLVLGILGFFTCGLTALFGLILGIMAIAKVSNSGGTLRGKGIAIAGTVVSGMFLLMLPVSIAMLLPAFASAKSKAMQISCMNNEKQLALAVLMYSNDHTNHYPPAATWCDAIKSSVASDRTFKCPASGNSTSRCDYAFNAKLDGLDASKVNPQTVVLFDSDGGWNAHGGSELESPRHPRKVFIVAFADGHVEAVSPARVSSLRWDP